MKTLKIQFALILFSAAACLAGSIDDFSKSVVFLVERLPIVETNDGVAYILGLKNPTNNTFYPKLKTISGTGFIVISSNIAYLVTAKHVATNMSPDCEVIMGGEKEEPLHLALSAITGQPNIPWFHHPTADISVHPLPSITVEGGKVLNRRAIALAVLSPDTNSPSRDIYFTALGFPLGLGAEGQFIPLTRDSKVSSGMLHDGMGLYFLLQDPSVSGYSGGPLIQTGDPRVVGTSGGLSVVSGGARCLGFVLGTYGDESGGKMTRITPAFYAVDLILEIEKNFTIVSTPEPPKK